MKLEIAYDNGLENIAQRIAGGMGEIIAAGAQTVCDGAKSLCPVDTGTLRDSISMSASGSSAVVSANTDYAAYVEFGTSKMAPQPYLVPALVSSADAITNAMLSVIAGN